MTSSSAARWARSHPAFCRYYVPVVVTINLIVTLWR